jgi:hypothetical protein
MTQYMLLVQNNARSKPTSREWDHFLALARNSRLFEGGSALGHRIVIGDTESAQSSDHIVGFMRFSSSDKQELLDLLQQHPIVLRGGSVELCEMPKS